MAACGNGAGSDEEMKVRVARASSRSTRRWRRGADGEKRRHRKVRRPRRSTGRGNGDAQRAGACSTAAARLRGACGRAPMPSRPAGCRGSKLIFPRTTGGPQRCPPSTPTSAGTQRHECSCRGGWCRENGAPCMNASKPSASGPLRSAPTRLSLSEPGPLRGPQLPALLIITPASWSPARLARARRRCCRRRRGLTTRPRWRA